VLDGVALPCRSTEAERTNLVRDLLAPPVRHTGNRAERPTAQQAPSGLTAGMTSQDPRSRIAEQRGNGFPQKRARHDNGFAGPNQLATCLYAPVVGESRRPRAEPTRRFRLTAMHAVRRGLLVGLADAGPPGTTIAAMLAVQKPGRNPTNQSRLIGADRRASNGERRTSHALGLGTTLAGISTRTGQPKWGRAHPVVGRLDRTSKRWSSRASRPDLIVLQRPPAGYACGGRAEDARPGGSGPANQVDSRGDFSPGELQGEAE